MALFDNITMDITDKLTVKRWSEDVSTQAMNALSFADLIGTRQDAAVCKDSTVARGMGDTITFPYRMQTWDEGLSGNGTILGNEAKIEYGYDQLSLDRKTFQWIAPTKFTIEQQRVPMKMIADAQDFVAVSFSKYISMVFFAQICGYSGAHMYNGVSFIDVSPEQLPAFQGFNPITPSSRIYKIGKDSEPANSKFLKLSDIDLLKLQAEAPADGAPVIRKLGLRGGRVDYILFITPQMAAILRHDPAVGELQDLSKFFQMGMEDKSDYWSGFSANNGTLGIYNGVEIRTTPYLPQTADGKNATAAFIGAQAAFMGFGETADEQSPAIDDVKNPLYLTMADYLYPYGDQHGFAGKAILGLKKAVFKTDKNSFIDNAVITVPAYHDIATVDFAARPTAAFGTGGKAAKAA